MIAKRRPFEARHEPAAQVTSRLQRVLDALEFSPALIKTSAWDIVAWNRAAATVLTDYGALAPEQRNVLRLLFCDPAIRSRNPHWESQARLVVSTFRLQTARAGDSGTARALVEEMSRSSADFAAMWRENDVSAYGEGVKHIDHPLAGRLVLEYSTLAVEGQPDLSLVIYTPATPADLDRIRSLIRN